MNGPGGRPWYERYFGADYWVYAGAEYTAERTAAEVDYLAAVLEREAPGRRVLDVGCGTGRHAVGLALRGFDVVGVDVSPWALDRARSAAERAGVSVGLFQLDALRADVDWPVAPVDAVVCVQAFGWGTDAQQLRMLRALRRLLVPAGLLVLDHSNVSAILRMYSARSVASVDGHTFEFLRRYDQLTGRSGGVLRVRRPSGDVVELPDDVRLYQPPEVAALLASAGFHVRRADADFRIGAQVGMDTRYVQFVARAADRQASALVGHRAPAGADELDLRWAPDEVDFVEAAYTRAWREVATSNAADVTFVSIEGPNATSAALGNLRERARRYDLADPYGAQRSTGVLAKHFGVPLEPAQVTAGAGATGLLRALAALGVRDTVLVEAAGHPELALAAGEVGAAVRTVPCLELPEVRAVRPAVTVLDRPGVTGRVWPVDDVRVLAEAAAEAGGVLVVDETCASYLPPAESAVALLAGPTSGLVVVRSVSKGYCCGGLRVGFALASADVAERVRAVCPPLAAGALALDVALALLGQGDVLAGLRARVAQVKPEFVGLLAGAGFDVQAGDARLPWVLVRRQQVSDAAEGLVRVPNEGGAEPSSMAHGATRRGIAGKDVPGAPGLVRLSVPLSEDRWRRAVAALGGRP